ncbi:enoyl-CoA hydratase/isomerase family protein [Amycolatopsis benzoatilytica]|uniref:enoyl-CoA hydratase/isomerase family protein n=1 Tax=Amycolatopsis benzoatilytica TaxID=346045 RepID=UPI000375FE78|nr:enoyl-CoA hydratase/isomerase family protein [Amycolatopsis benzoatilytica]
MTSTCPSGFPAASGTVTVRASADEQVATILIDRADQLNALTLDLLADLDDALAEIADSPARVVLVRTAGEKAFCVGADIKVFSRLAPEEMWRRWIASGHRTFDRLAGLPQPTIAVVDGLALGGGLELAMSCDLRIAHRRAEFGLPETGLGTIPGWGGTARLTDLAGPSRAKHLILTRRRIDADTALAWGVVNSVADDLEAAVGGFVRDLLDSAPIAQQVAKQLVDAAAAGAPSSVLEAIASGFTAHTADFREGVRAFTARATPQFQGR